MHFLCNFSTFFGFERLKFNFEYEKKTQFFFLFKYEPLGRLRKAVMKAKESGNSIQVGFVRNFIRFFTQNFIKSL